MVIQIENFKISECRKIIFFIVVVDVQKLMIRYATILKIFSSGI